MGMSEVNAYLRWKHGPADCPPILYMCVCVCVCVCVYVISPMCENKTFAVGYTLKCVHAKLVVLVLRHMSPTGGTHEATPGSFLHW